MMFVHVFIILILACAPAWAQLPIKIGMTGPMSDGQDAQCWRKITITFHHLQAKVFCKPTFSLQLFLFSSMSSSKRSSQWNVRSKGVSCLPWAHMTHSIHSFWGKECILNWEGVDSAILQYFTFFRGSWSLQPLNPPPNWIPKSATPLKERNISKNCRVLSRSAHQTTSNASLEIFHHLGTEVTVLNILWIQLNILVKDSQLHFSFEFISLAPAGFNFN